MIVSERDGIKYYHFESMMDSGILQAVFTRIGGISSYPWSTLNLGGTVGDLPQHVAQNLTRILNVSDISLDSLAQIRQIHSSQVILIDRPSDGEFNGDAMITNRPGINLLMRFADCVPIIFFDPLVQAVGIAHAGWKGTVKQVAKHTILKMNQEFGTKPEDLIAGIGPSIGPDHYEVGEDVIGEVKETFPEHWTELLVSSSGGVKFDMWKANQLSLLDAGVKQIEVSEICTACNINEWFSHRAESGKTGRFAAVVGLR